VTPGDLTAAFDSMSSHPYVAISLVGEGTVAFETSASPFPWLGRIAGVVMTAAIFLRRLVTLLVGLVIVTLTVLECCRPTRRYRAFRRRRTSSALTPRVIIASTSQISRRRARKASLMSSRRRRTTTLCPGVLYGALTATCDEARW
jgi:hypothetical protein